MTTPHKVLMSNPANTEKQDFYRDLTPPRFDLVWVEAPDDPAAVAAALKDVEFSYGRAPSSEWLDLAPNLRLCQLGGVGYADAVVQAAREREFCSSWRCTNICHGHTKR